MEFTVVFFFLMFLCRSHILVAHSSRLSLLRKSHDASFQVDVTCRFYPLEGLTVRETYNVTKCQGNPVMAASIHGGVVMLLVV